MGLPRPDFRQTWLWENTFVSPRLDSSPEEQAYFRDNFLKMRENVAHLVARISSENPNLTVHDMTHLDALWGTASIVAEGNISLSAAEGYVFGASILLHDSALTVSAYPEGIATIQQTTEWRDAVARWNLSKSNTDTSAYVSSISTEDLEKNLLPDVLRRLHAQQAGQLAEQSWKDDRGEVVYLIDDPDLRMFYGKTIGDIAHSHWWNITKLEEMLSEDLGALSNRTNSKIDRIKIACLLRIADALHLDKRRAPRFLRALTKPSPPSALHWTFQERLAMPHIESDSVVFTAGQPFNQTDSESWWLAYDTLEYVDRELASVDTLLRSRGREALKARRVKGAGSPDTLSKLLPTRNWQPVDARFRASDVPRIVENLGGAKLYGDDPTISLRELIQNATDAINARRALQKRPSWGRIDISIRREGEQLWLVVEDNGIGMSELVLTGPLLDFGTSFWRSTLSLEEFPGLASSGLKPIGQFGIGFFSVFMLGDTIRVTSRRYDRGEDTAKTLEISGGPSGRPILFPTLRGQSPIDGGTRVEIRLHDKPGKFGRLLGIEGGATDASLCRTVSAIAPTLNVSVNSMTNGTMTVALEADDWLQIPGTSLLDRIGPNDSGRKSAGASSLIKPLIDDDGNVHGRAGICLDDWWRLKRNGWITISGLRANQLYNIHGVLTGEATTASRNRGVPTVPLTTLAKWASEQAKVLARLRVDDERKARAAEVILVCGGKIGSLPIARIDSEWISVAELKKKMASQQEMVFHFNGNIEYDEDSDDMHPRKFKDEFVESSDVAFVLNYDGRIIQDEAAEWPPEPRGRASHRGCVAELIRETICKVWGEYDEFTEARKVGNVDDHEVVRDVSVFVKHERS